VKARAHLLQQHHRVFTSQQPVVQGGEQNRAFRAEGKLRRDDERYAGLVQCVANSFVVPSQESTMFLDIRVLLARLHQRGFFRQAYS